ncbi:MAG: hypothetical protein IT453_15710 [Planctomycetes bacterium]|nr:hypothetical protein [Planctomycetota bacterium]
MLDHLLCLLPVSLLTALPLLADGKAQSYCITSPNSVGAGAHLAWVGPVNLDEGALLVTGAPADQGGLFIYGTGRALTPLFQGYSCFPRPRLIFAAKRLSDQGTCVLAFAQGVAASELANLQALADAGVELSFQYVYSDPAAGVNVANATDAVAAQF